MQKESRQVWLPPHPARRLLPHTVRADSGDEAATGPLCAACLPGKACLVDRCTSYLSDKLIIIDCSFFREWNS